MNDDIANSFRDYLRRVKSPEDDRCWFCGKTPDQIRQDFLEYMKRPDKEFEDLQLDDVLIMSYKTKKPICAGCYFAIKQNPKLVEEILKRPPEEIWP